MEQRYMYLHMLIYDFKKSIIIHIQMEHHARTAAPLLSMCAGQTGSDLIFFMQLQPFLFHS